MAGFGEALNLTIKSMLLSVRGGSQEEIDALSTAADAAMKASGVGAGIDMKMLLGITAGTLGLVVASVPPDGYEAMEDEEGYEDEIPSSFRLLDGFDLDPVDAQMYCDTCWISRPMIE
eukprot:scaffold255327_cov24-Prasinocladus_malaysianus.AAC.1